MFLCLIKKNWLDLSILKVYIYLFLLYPLILDFLCKFLGVPLRYTWYIQYHLSAHVYFYLYYTCFFKVPNFIQMDNRTFRDVQIPSSGWCVCVCVFSVFVVIYTIGID